MQVSEHHTLIHRAAELRPDTVLKLFNKTDAFRRPDRFTEFLLACEADARGRTGLEDVPYIQATLIRTALDASLQVDNAAIQALGVSGPAFGEALNTARLELIRAALKRAREPASP